MTTLALSLILQASVLASGDENYATAYKKAQTGQPLVVLVGAEWCPGCRTMKQSVMNSVLSCPAIQTAGTRAKTDSARANRGTRKPMRSKPS